MLSAILLFLADVHERGPIPLRGIKAPESAHYFAALLMKWIKDFLHAVGLGGVGWLGDTIYIVIVCLTGILIGLIIQKLLLALLGAFSGRIKSEIFDNLRAGRFFTKLSRILPALFILAMLAYAFVKKDFVVTVLMRGCWVYIVFIIALAMNDCIYAIWVHIDERENKRRLPLKGLSPVYCGDIVFLFQIYL